MDKVMQTRRGFVVESCSLLGGTWFATHLPGVRAAAEYARRAFQQGEPMRVLTPAEAVELTAIAEQIIPATDTPGARDAGVIYFIDRALETFSSDLLATIRAGLGDLQRAVDQHPSHAPRFSELVFAQQTAILETLEETEFFAAARSLTITGMFANQSHGGNRNEVGWELLGFDHSPIFSPPFGYYDGEAAGGR